MTLARHTNRLLLSVRRSVSITLSGKHNREIQEEKHPTLLTFARLNNTICWKCGQERNMNSQVFCEKCQVIQAPQEKNNYFKVFELEERFSIDEQDLRTRFRKLQSLLHPDKFSNKSYQEQKISEEYSSLLNKAFNNLHVPLKRAEHLLNLNGEKIGEGQGLDDPEFLMEIMELNEEVGNAGTDKDKLKELNAKNRVKLENVIKEIDRCFENDDIREAKLNTIKLKYFSSLDKRINDILRELGDAD